MREPMPMFLKRLLMGTRMPDPAAGGGGGGGGGAPPAIDYNAVYGTLSAENKEVFTRKGFDKAGGDGKPIDINGVFDWARNAERLVGGDNIPAPRLDNDEEWAKWPGHEKLGVPKEGKGYNIQRLQMPNGVQYDEEGETLLRNAFAKAKVYGKQAQILYNELASHRVGEQTKAAEQLSTAKTAMETELRTTFGAGLDVAMKRADMALRYIAGKANVKVERAIDGIASLVGDGAGAIKVLHWIGQQLGEDVIKGGHDAGFAEGPAAAKAEMEKLRLDAEFMKAYNKDTHPGHKDAVARMTRLAQIAGQANNKST